MCSSLIEDKNCWIEFTGKLLKKHLSSNSTDLSESPYSEYLLLSPEERENYKEDKSLATWVHLDVLQYIEKDSPLKEFLQDIEKQKEFSDLFS